MRILILGASYGSLLGVKCAAAGHSVDLVCREVEAHAINQNGAVVRFPVKGDDGSGRTVDVNSKELPGTVSAGGTNAFTPSDYDLVALAMQEPQYAAADVRRLLQAVATARRPCLSIMNMPPLPFLHRIPKINLDAIRDCYTEPEVWDGFDPALVTLCSPDPQTVRLPHKAGNVLHVGLATNFKAARFEDDKYTAMLRELERDIDAVRFMFEGLAIELPVKLRVHESLFVPLAKWCMLLTGNYRCVGPDTMHSIADAVHLDLAASKGVYQWVMQVCRLLGAEEADLVPFEKYAAATRSLKSPSSAARALANGACDIERVDRLVQRIAAQFEMDSRVVNETVTLVDERLRGNRKAAFPAQVSGGGDRTNGASIPRGEREDVRFEWLGIDDATPQFVAHWHDLGLAASTPNIYLMPEFVLPAIRYLDTDKAPRFAALWNANRSALVALGVFNAVRPSWRFPFARLSAVRSKHSFQSGVLMRAGIDARAMDHFIDGLFGSSWRAVRFNELREDSFVFRQLLESAQRRGLRWLVDRRYERAAVELAPNSAWRKYIPHSRHRRLRRARAKLEELGHVEFRVVQGSDVSDGNADAFLRLESMGWKKKSVLLATSQETLFFREMMHACRERGLVFFCELLLDGTVIASTSNFQINGSGFAFKVGNDPAYAKLSPGLLVEYAFLESSAEMCPKLREIESGAQAGSFIELLWPDRIPIVSGHLLAGPLPTAYAFVKQHLKTARRLITRR